MALLQLTELLLLLCSRHLGIKKERSNDLWVELRDGFDLSGYEHPRVDAQLSWYVKNQRYIDRVTNRAINFGSNFFTGIYFTLADVAVMSDV